MSRRSSSKSCKQFQPKAGLQVHYYSKDGSLNDYVSEQTLNNFLSSKYFFNNIDEFRDFHSKNKYITLFDEETLNKHIKVSKCRFSYDKDDNLRIDRFM